MNDQLRNLSQLTVVLAAGETRSYGVTGARLWVLESDGELQCKVGNRDEIPLNLGWAVEEDFASLTFRNANDFGVTMILVYGTAQFTDNRLNVVTTRPNQFVVFQEGSTVARVTDGTIATAGGTVDANGFSGVANSVTGRRKSFVVTNHSATGRVWILKQVGTAYPVAAIVFPESSIQLDTDETLWVNTPGTSNGGVNNTRVSIVEICYTTPLNPGVLQSSLRPGAGFASPVIESVTWEWEGTETGWWDAIVTWKWLPEFWASDSEAEISATPVLGGTVGIATLGKGDMPDPTTDSIVTRIEQVSETTVEFGFRVSIESEHLAQIWISAQTLDNPPIVVDGLERPFRVQVANGVFLAPTLLTFVVSAYPLWNDGTNFISLEWDSGDWKLTSNESVCSASGTGEAWGSETWGDYSGWLTNGGTLPPTFTPV